MSDVKVLLNDKENRAADKFMWEHYGKCKKQKNAGVRLTLTADATGIASKIVVQCPHCKAVKDISDYDSW